MTANLGSTGAGAHFDVHLHRRNISDRAIADQSHVIEPAVIDRLVPERNEP